MRDPTNPNRELPREWKNLIILAKSQGHGTLRIKIRDGKTYIAERIVQQIKLNEASEEKMKIVFL